jgi:hypothetical protein
MPGGWVFAGVGYLKADRLNGHTSTSRIHGGPGGALQERLLFPVGGCREPGCGTEMVLFARRQGLTAKIPFHDDE